MEAFHVSSAKFISLRKLSTLWKSCSKKCTVVVRSCNLGLRTFLQKFFSSKKSIRGSFWTFYMSGKPGLHFPDSPVCLRPVSAHTTWPGDGSSPATPPLHLLLLLFPQDGDGHHRVPAARRLRHPHARRPRHSPPPPVARPGRARLAGPVTATILLPSASWL